MTKRDTLIYRDTHTGGWVVRILALGEWYVLGVYGTRAAAAKAARG